MSQWTYAFDGMKISALKHCSAEVQNAELAMTESSNPKPDSNLVAQANLPPAPALDSIDSARAEQNQAAPPPTNNAPAHWTKDFVEHLRTVHFALVTVAVGLFFLSLRPYDSRLALKQIQQILQLKSDWKPEWIRRLPRT